MPRIVRGLIDGGIYHVLNRGNGGQKIFHKDGDYEAFIELIKEAKKRHYVEILGYCLMPNHFHMVLSPLQAEDLSKWMQWLMTSHVRRYHQHYKSAGHIWQGRFKSFLVQTDNHFLMVLRYVEANPVRACIVRSACDWQWSSHNETIGKKTKMLVAELPINLPTDWCKYVDEPITNVEIDRIRESVVRQLPYGNLDWQLQVCRTLGLESSLMPRGRPKRGQATFF